MTDWDITISEDTENKVVLSETDGVSGHRVTFTKEGNGEVSFRGTWPYMDFFTPSDRHRDQLDSMGYELVT